MSNQLGLWAAGRTNWRFFAFAWSLPLLLYAEIVVWSLAGTMSVRAGMWLFPIEVVVIIGFISCATLPYWRRTVTGLQAVFWVFLVPILIFCALSILPFRWPVSAIMLTPSR